MISPTPGTWHNGEIVTDRQTDKNNDENQKEIGKMSR
jgi:hypothetical protein